MTTEQYFDYGEGSKSENKIKGRSKNNLYSNNNLYSIFTIFSNCEKICVVTYEYFTYHHNRYKNDLKP